MHRLLVDPVNLKEYELAVSDAISGLMTQKLEELIRESEGLCAYLWVQSCIKFVSSVACNLMVCIVNLSWRLSRISSSRDLRINSEEESEPNKFACTNISRRFLIQRRQLAFSSRLLEASRRQARSRFISNHWILRRWAIVDHIRCFLHSRNNQPNGTWFVYPVQWYSLHLSIYNRHDIKPGLIDFFGKQPGLPSMDNWCFIILGPNQTLICLQPWQGEMRKLQPCSAVMS